MTGKSPLRVLLLLGSEADAPQAATHRSEGTPLSTLLSSGDHIALSVISLGASLSFDGTISHHRLPEDSRGRLDTILGALGAFRLHRRLSTFPVGRLLNSVGPVAPSRLFWRTLRHDPEAMRLLRSADVVIASDLETTKAAWIAARRDWVGDAIYDHRAIAAMSEFRTEP